MTECIICNNETDNPVVCSNCGSSYCLECLKETFKNKESKFYQCCIYCTMKFAITTILKIDDTCFERYLDQYLTPEDSGFIKAIKSVIRMFTKIENSYINNTYTVLCVRLTIEKYLRPKTTCEEFVSINDESDIYLLSHIKVGGTPPLYYSVRNKDTLIQAIREGQSEILKLQQSTFFSIYNLVTGKRRATFASLKAPKVIHRIKDCWNEIGYIIKQAIIDLTPAMKHRSYLCENSEYLPLTCNECWLAKLNKEFKCCKCGTIHCNKCGQVLDDHHICKQWYINDFKEKMENSMVCYKCKHVITKNGNKFRYFCESCHCSYSVYIHDVICITETSPTWEEVYKANDYHLIKQMDVFEVNNMFRKLKYPADMKEIFELMRDLLIASKTNINILKDLFVDNIVKEFPPRNFITETANDILLWLIPIRLEEDIEDMMVMLLEDLDEDEPITVIKIRRIISDLGKLLSVMEKEARSISIDKFKQTKLYKNINYHIIKFIEEKKSRRSFFKSGVFKLFINESPISCTISDTTNNDSD